MKCFKKQPIIRLLVFSTETASKLEKVGPTFSSFNPFPSLLSAAKNACKQNKRHNIVFSIKR